MLPGTLAALKDLFSGQRTIVSPAGVSAVVLTPADIGRLVVVNTAAALANAVTITLPAIGGNAGAGINSIGRGGTIAILRLGANAGAVNVTSAADTFNGGQAFGPINLGTAGGVNSWLFAISPGGVGVQDWAIQASIPGAL